MTATQGTLQALLQGLAGRGDHTAVLWLRGEAEAVRLSYAELAEQIGRVAGGLRKLGVEAGEPVAIFAPNRPEWIVASLAVVAAGAVVVPIDVRLGKKNLQHELRHSKCRRVFTLPEQAAAIGEAVGKKAAPQPILFEGEAEEGEAVSWRSLLKSRPQEPPEFAPEQTAALFYTSGTTGKPKGVPLTHANLASNLDALKAEGLASPAERTLVPLPLHHVYPFMVGMLVLLDGGATLVLPSGVSGPEIARALREAELTSIIGVPRLYDALLAAIHRNAEARGRLAKAALAGLLHLSIWVRRKTGRRVGRVLLRPLHARLAPRLRLLASGGAALDPETAWELEGLGWEVLTGYGLTETSPIVAFTPRGRAKIGTAGRPLPGVELRLRPVENRPGGEVQVRGPNVFSGYHDDPKATEKVFDEGWFRTGDLGELDEEGNLVILARVTETIVLPGGKNIFPEEVEEHYAASPLIQEFAVLEHEGALVGLVVADPKAAKDASAGSLKTAVRREVRESSFGLPPYQRVTDYALSDHPLPRTALGKLRRHLLPELYVAAKTGAAPSAEAMEELSAQDEQLLRSDSARRVWEALKRRYPNRQMSLDANPQVDLGIDSLEWVSLTLELQEEHGLRLNEEAIARIGTVRDLLEEASQAKPGEPGKAEALGPEQRRWIEPPGAALGTLSAVLFWINRLVFRLLFRLRVEGREHLPEDGPAVIGPNHTSFLDPFVVAAALPQRYLGRTYFAGITTYLFSSAPRRAFSQIAHVFPVDPEHAPATSLGLGRAVLERGDFLVWFPEGARSVDGRLQAFMPGLARLIEDTPATFVPISISGTFEAWPRHRGWPRLRPVRVRIGEPVVAGQAGSADREAAKAAVEALHRRLEGLA